MPARRTPRTDPLHFVFFQKQPGRKSRCNANQDRKENHDRNHIQGYCTAGDCAGDKGIDRKEDSDSHNVIQNGHRKKCVGHRAFCMEFLDDR